MPRFLIERRFSEGVPIALGKPGACASHLLHHDYVFPSLEPNGVTRYPGADVSAVRRGRGSGRPQAVTCEALPTPAAWKPRI
jgi:hypothetical protein